MDKKSKKIAAVYSYKVTMLVHVIAENTTDARNKLDDQGGIMTSREVEELNIQPLYKEEKEKN